MTPQDRLREALKRLRIDANRLCDRNLGGTYEDDCRRSIAAADAVLAETRAAPVPADPNYERALRLAVSSDEETAGEDIAWANTELAALLAAGCPQAPDTP